MGIRDKNKKGFFFTTIAIALSIVLILSYNVYTGYRLTDKMEAIEIRVDTMSSFIKDMENDMENAIFTVGFRSLLSVEDYMMANDDFINNLGTNLNNAFDEVFRQGTINAEVMGLMKNNTFAYWTNKMIEQADKTNIILNFTVNGATITQTEPWMVDIEVDLRINVTDKKNTASWIIDKDFTKKINITGFVDPLYLVNNDGLVNNTIRKTTVTNFGAGLSTHVNNGYYREHSGAPSYLMRFENNLASSPYGIESLVNPQKLRDANLPTSSRSAVDFIYYGVVITSNCHIQQITDPDFFLDYSPTNHRDFYQATCTS